MTTAPDIVPATEIVTMIERFAEASPLSGVAITFLVYFGAVSLHRALGSPILIHPLLIAIAAIALALQASGVSYDVFYRSAEPLHWLLAPAVILLAVPLWRQLGAIRSVGLRLVPVLLVGAATGIATSAGIALMLGAPETVVAALTPKSVTIPVAVGLSESLGGEPAITAIVVILSGLIGATIGLPALRLCGVRDPRAQGLAMGVGSNMIGTARSFQISQVVGAFASLGMILNALVTTALIALLCLLS